MSALAVLTTAVIQAAVPVGVGAREYRFAVYRPSVPTGYVRFNVHNFGEDAHNLELRGPHRWRSTVSPDIASGQTLGLTVRIRRPGRYTLLCTKPGHAALGMRATIVVR